MTYRHFLQIGNGGEGGEGDIETGDVGPDVDSHGQEHALASSGRIHQLSEYVRYFNRPAIVSYVHVILVAIDQWLLATQTTRSSPWWLTLTSNCSAPLT